MPRRELLTPTERGQLFAFPEDEGELIRLATLARGDLTYIRQHRGDHNRLDLAIQMVYLRHPSRVLPPSEAPYPPLLGIVAAQLKVTLAAWSQYAKRDETRREHLQELLERFELRQFDRRYYRELIDWLMPLALQTTQGMVLGSVPFAGVEAKTSNPEATNQLGVLLASGMIVGEGLVGVLIAAFVAFSGKDFPLAAYSGPSCSRFPVHRERGFQRHVNTIGRNMHAVTNPQVLHERARAGSFRIL